MRDSNLFQEAESKFRILGGLHHNRTRGRKARREGGGANTSPSDEKPIRSVLEHDEDFDRVSRITHERLPFERKRKRKREIVFFWAPKETKAAGGIFRVSPCTPKLLIPPQTKYLERAEHSPPYLRGQKGNVNKRTNEMRTSTHQKTRRRQ